MATHLPFLPVLLHILLTTAASAGTTTSTTVSITPTSSTITPTAASPSPVSLLSPDSSPPQEQEQAAAAHFNTIIDALLNAGDFGNWANLLAEADPSIIPFSATFFVPDDAALLAAVDSSAPLNFVDPLLFPYHVVPLRLPFSALRLFPAGSRLPILLLGFSLLITNTSATNFTIDGDPISRPDLYQNSLVSVHGIGGVFQYTLFGKDSLPSLPPSPPPPEFTAGEEVDVNENEEVPADYGIPNGGIKSTVAGFWVGGLLALFWASRNVD